MDNENNKESTTMSNYVSNLIKSFDFSATDIKFLVLLSLIVLIVYYKIDVKNVYWENSLGLYYICSILLYVIFKKIMSSSIVEKTDTDNDIIESIKEDKRFKREAYHINYINPYITNVDKLDFTNRPRSVSHIQYIKNELDNNLMSKYVQFNKVLSYIGNPMTIKKANIIYINNYTTNTPNVVRPPLSVGNYDMCINNPLRLIVLRKEDKVIKISNIYTVQGITNAYYYIFEYSTSDLYDMKDCISIIDNSGTTLITTEFNYKKRYICIKTTDKTSHEKAYKHNSAPIKYHIFKIDSATAKLYKNQYEMTDPDKYDCNCTPYDFICLDVNYINSTRPTWDSSIKIGLNAYYNRKITKDSTDKTKLEEITDKVLKDMNDYEIQVTKYKKWFNNVVNEFVDIFEKNYTMKEEQVLSDNDMNSPIKYASDSIIQNLSLIQFGYYMSPIYEFKIDNMGHGINEKVRCF